MESTLKIRSVMLLLDFLYVSIFASLFIFYFFDNLAAVRYGLQFAPLSSTWLT